jgi:type VI secretion system protein ImpA
VADMSDGWDLATLLGPISEQKPCGDDIEYTLLPEFDALRVFGQSTPYEQPPDWLKIRNRSLEVLQKSKDLRVLAHLGAAALRTDGIAAFARTVEAAAGWLETLWDGVYPLVDEDAVIRRNALNNFSDPMAVVDAVRRAPLVANRQLGVVTLRDTEILAGQVTPAADEKRPDEAQMNAAFSAMPLAELQALIATVDGALAGLKRIDGVMRDKGGTEASPEFDPLLGQFGKMLKLLKTQLAARPEMAEQATPGEAGEGASGIATGPVRSRQDAIRALDAVAEFFRRTEPSSPVPLFLDRAKRLVSKDFLEVLADIAPEALPHARAASGVRSE